MGMDTVMGMGMGMGTDMGTDMVMAIRIQNSESSKIT